MAMAANTVEAALVELAAQFQRLLVEHQQKTVDVIGRSGRYLPDFRIFSGEPSTIELCEWLDLAEERFQDVGIVSDTDKARFLRNHCSGKAREEIDCLDLSERTRVKIKEAFKRRFLYFENLECTTSQKVIRPPLNKSDSEWISGHPAKL